MRLRIEHRTSYLYDEPPTSVVQILRLTPRDHEGQRVREWHIDVDQDTYLMPGEDAFGNVIHTLSLRRVVDDISISIRGNVETHDTGGVIRETFERFPPGLYLRETPLTQPDTSITDLARDAIRGNDHLADLHDLMKAIRTRLIFDQNQTDVTATAAQTLASGRGVCQDFTHVFIACARARDVPARYVSGYMARTDTVQQDAGHAWAEAFVPSLGWVGFDAANGVSPTEAYVRVGIGLDYLGAAPIRGAQDGGTAEHLSVSILVDQSNDQMQRQQQS